MLGPPLDPWLPAGDPSADAVAAVAAGWWWRMAWGVHNVVPDAGVDLLWTPGRCPWLAGPDTRPRQVTLTSGLAMIGVRLRPGVARAVLADDLDQALDRAVPLSAVAPAAVIDRLTDQLETAVAGRPGPAAAALDLARFALGRAGDDWEPDPVVCDGAERLRAGDPVDLHGLSQRQFRRRFIRSFGYGPAFYRRIVRLDRASDLLDRHPNDSISQVAALAGYSDESHLWRDATELTGSTPARMRAV